MVTRRVGELDYEVKRTDRGDACQIYHLNLLKRWNEGTSVGLAVVVSNEDNPGPKAALKHNPLALVSGGDHLSPQQLTDLAQLQADFDWAGCMAACRLPRPGFRHQCNRVRGSREGRRGSQG